MRTPSAREAGQGGAQARRTIIATGTAATKPYAFSDAATLMQDFWNDVDAVLRERGVTT